MNNDSLYYPLIDGEVRFVKVRFHSQERGEFDSKLYTYKTDIPLDVDDIVICEARAWYAVAKVIEVDVPMPVNDADTTFRWVVQRLNVEEHKERLGFERDLIKQINDTRMRNLRERVLQEMGLTDEGIARVKAIVSGKQAEPDRDVFEEVEVEEVYDDTQDYGELPVDDRHGFSHNDNN